MKQGNPYLLENLQKKNKYFSESFSEIEKDSEYYFPNLFKIFSASQSIKLESTFSFLKTYL